jgi:amidohydrolase
LEIALKSTNSTNTDPSLVEDYPLDCRPERVDSLLTQARDLEPELRAIRRSIHVNPELPYQEFATAALVSQKLESLGFRIICNKIAGSGLYADLGTGAAVAIRAGMDAQRQLELNPVSYRSSVADVMHACGHDAHVAAVLGAAELLSRQKFKGRVRIIMQPAEESADKMGSFHMIRAGALEEQKAILGLHVDTTLSAGKIGIVTQPVADHSCRFSIRLASSNNSEIGCIELTSRLLPLLNELRLHLIWRNADMEILEINVGSEKKQVLISGRLLGETIMIDSLKDSLADLCSLVFKHDFVQQVVLDDSCYGKQRSVADTAIAAASSVSNSQVIPLKRRTWTKDFAAYATLVPAAFLLFGTGGKGERVIHRSATFDIDESLLPLAAATLAEITVRLLEKEI